MYILPNPYGFTSTFFKVISFEPFIMLFISMKESTVEYILPQGSIKLFSMGHCVTSFRIQSCFGPYFPACGLNNSTFGHFLRSVNQRFL